MPRSKALTLKYLDFLMAILIKENSLMAKAPLQYLNYKRDNLDSGVG